LIVFYKGNPERWRVAVWAFLFEQLKGESIMLVFLSDIHLTDGSSGETIKPTAFKIFSDNLQQLIESVKATKPLKELKIVLLGDIFDIIRSTRWLGAGVRPWSPAGSRQKTVVLDILNDIQKRNQESLNYFNTLRDYAARKNLPFEIRYVLGNHDWLINRYPETRDLVADWLGMNLKGEKLPLELFSEDYKVLARHGDCYDEFNYMGDRDASSIGDAIVVELLNRFPGEVEKKLEGRHPEVVRMLKELDNIRPLLDAPSWVLMVMNRAQDADVRKIIEKTWTKCVDGFFQVSFIKKMDIPFWPDTVDKLEIALQLTSHLSKAALEKISELRNLFMVEADEYGKRAFAEPAMRAGSVSFVLYGHTHDHRIVPLDQVPLSQEKVLNKIYFNTGTWRKTWNKATFDTIHREFIGWHVLTYIGIYREDENDGYDFEIWNGALG